MGCSNVVKRLFASNINRFLVPLIRPAATSPLMDLKRMTPGGSDSHLTISSQPFFERDFFNRFPVTRRFSRLVRRWAAHPSTEQPMGPRYVLDTPECLTFYMNLSGWNPDKLFVEIRQDERPDMSAELFISGQADLTFGYVAPCHRNCNWWLILPHKIHHYKLSDIKAEIGRNSGELKISIPKVKPYKDRFFNCVGIKPSVIDH